MAGYLYDRNLDDGRGEITETKVPLDSSPAHITQFDRTTNTRVSWDTDGKDENSRENLHTTDQNRAKGSKGRHRSPKLTQQDMYW